MILFNVNHSLTFFVKNGLSGKFLKALVAIYKSVMSCVRIENRLTEFFDCSVGLRQSCILSPILFSSFINEIASITEQQGVHGMQLLPGLMELFLLLSVDDILLVSYTPMVLSSVCKNRFLGISTDKTNIMIFRKGGYLGRHEKCYLDSKDLSCQCIHFFGVDTHYENERGERCN